MQKCQSFENPMMMAKSMAERQKPSAKKGRRRSFDDDDDEDFDETTDDDNNNEVAKPKPTPVKAKSSEDEFYTVTAAGKKTAKLAELASLACSNSELVGRTIEKYA